MSEPRGISSKIASTRAGASSPPPGRRTARLAARHYFVLVSIIELITSHASLSARADTAIAAADTLLLTVPNQLGVDYNAHVIESILKHVAPALGWR